VGKHGSIAVIERFIQTVKNECTRVIMIPFRRRSFREELARFVEWYNQWRPHMTLDGRTPDEVYHKQHPACRYPRFEPRSRWPRRAACAQPGSPIRGKPGVALELHVDLHGGRKHLPVITLKRAA
jgi:hypothetical protein